MPAVAALDRWYLCARIRMHENRPVQVALAELTGRTLMAADANLRRVSANSEAWICLRELPDGERETAAAGESGA